MSVKSTISLDLLRNKIFKHNKEKSKLEALLDIKLLSLDTSSSSVVRNGYKFIIQKNQIVTSAYELSERWLWHSSKVNRFINQLETLGYLKILKKTTKGSVIQVLF